MAERLCLGNEVKELKLGSTFNSNRRSAYHTVKYDFKPASVDDSKMATVEVGSNNTMTVTVPHLDGAGIPHTVFKGSQRPYSKECVLIIDHVSGEITLEKLSSNIQVKKTRVEQKIHSSSNIPNSTSSNNSNNTNSLLPTQPTEQQKRSPTHGRTSSRTKVTSGKKREPTVQLHPAPKQQPSPRRVSPYHGKSPPSIMNNNSSPRQSTNLGTPSFASLPMIGGDFDDFLSTSAAPTTPSNIPTHTIINTSLNLPTQTTSTSKIGDLSESSSNSSGSDSSDSDSEEENISNPTIINERTNGNIQSATLNNNLLNQDLQLSESESDSN
ncbi:hypothetical protein HCN44_006152 [Aphidius gifuensis]|uniref:Ell-associated factor Eaf n=1 Tax=Aphidius gifuensis TaxID=684658 RepID=A0A834Y3W2_APHGI|nr:ell-associated factor Eaf [Aphidius gifuensis]XP_044008554.1 ell-associated factor Eaf [Aphidius gifuensis]XP_044008560.1 ell-associated factor Eaf [Aphidius gifuensis]XP_044008568.1 ell-associated factor Eaf [Aphidius gifuensis]XP_044008578.1 ell-associated factor Eaf [Aphidius gifuensis]XP_044008585.1 ell-associated factor Eaf [Aphidius gifuensis]XP_044008592.1 ell-associated factor Eaf [Aphidius gifuensis]KAF7997581.1 hypothetical protein HCN44_006152 [Aphidius gifuensis]